MATKSTGVYQKDNGFWEYRFIMVVNGRKISKKKSTDAFGNKLKTKRKQSRQGKQPWPQSVTVSQRSQR